MPHSTWSASATDRNVACPGAIALTDGLPETTSEAADWGTCCHEIAAECLNKGGDAAEWIGVTVKGKKFEFTVDEEMADTAQVYIDYVRALPGDQLWIEETFSLAPINPPFDAGGTCDALSYDAKRRHMHVVDLKGGRGVVVSVTGNKQMRTYALGALLAHPGKAVDTITVTIVQPRANHPDGIIRSETFDVIELMEWTTDLRDAMRQSKAALVQGRPYADQPLDAVWVSTWLKAGDHCKFCPAAGFCPALEQRATDAAGVWFDDLDRPRISNRPEDFTPEQLAQRLDMLDMIQEWINEVRAYAHRQAEAGVAIPGYKLVEKIGNRAWKVDEMTVFDMLTSNGVANDKAYIHKLVSPAQAEKLLGAKKKQAVEGLTERPVRGTNLVQDAKTTRPSVPAAADRFFDKLD